MNLLQCKFQIDFKTNGLNKHISYLRPLIRTFAKRNPNFHWNEVVKCKIVLEEEEVSQQISISANTVVFFRQMHFNPFGEVQ